MPKILVIEDNPANLELATYLLRAFGHETRSASNGEEGIMRARSEPADLIICDLQMPGMSGFEVARALKADPVLNRIPLIAVTAYAMLGDREKALAAGFDGYVAKPIDPQRFLPQVEKFLPPSAPHAPQVNTALQENPPAPPGNRTTILVVDNSRINQNLLASLLEPHGYRVLLCSTMRAGLERARENLPDLIISDLHMPGENGFDFIRAVKADARLKATPFLFLSSTMWREKDRSDGLALGAVKFITRPIEARQLLKEIEECLE